MDSNTKIERQIKELIAEHKLLHEQIEGLELKNNAFEILNIKRLKKRKLIIKDKISYLESLLHPDIIA